MSTFLRTLNPKHIEYPVSKVRNIKFVFEPGNFFFLNQFKNVDVSYLCTEIHSIFRTFLSKFILLKNKSPT